MPTQRRGIQSRKPGRQRVQGNEVSPPEKELRTPHSPGQPGRCPSPTALARRSRKVAVSHTPDAGTRGHTHSEVTQKTCKGSLSSSRPDRPARCRETPAWMSVPKPQCGLARTCCTAPRSLSPRLGNRTPASSKCPRSKAARPTWLQREPELGLEGGVKPAAASI